MKTFLLQFLCDYSLSLYSSLLFLQPEVHRYSTKVFPPATSKIVSGRPNRRFATVIYAIGQSVGWYAETGQLDDGRTDGVDYMTPMYIIGSLAYLSPAALSASTRSHLPRTILPPPPPPPRNWNGVERSVACPGSDCWIKFRSTESVVYWDSIERERGGRPQVSDGWVYVFRRRGLPLEIWIYHAIL